MMFADRLDAATRLSKALQGWRGCNPQVLAIPHEEEKRLQLDARRDRRARYRPGRGAARPPPP
ncbi:hypothetical protein [Variovorax paradoxus]|nr:hypothetical protein [Variovorax paradoxus]